MRSAGFFARPNQAGSIVERRPAVVAGGTLRHPANASLTRLANVNSISARYQSHGPGVARTPLPEVQFSAAIAFNGFDRHQSHSGLHVRLSRRPDPLADPGRHAADRRHRDRRDRHGRQFPRARAAQQRTRAGKHRAAAGPPFRPAARGFRGRPEGPDRVHARPAGSRPRRTTSAGCPARTSI